MLASLRMGPPFVRFLVDTRVAPGVRIEWGLNCLARLRRLRLAGKRTNLVEGLKAPESESRFDEDVRERIHLREQARASMRGRRRGLVVGVWLPGRQ